MPKSIGAFCSDRANWISMVFFSHLLFWYFGFQAFNDYGYGGDASSAPYADCGLRMIRPQLYDNEPIERFSALRVWAPLIEQKRLHGVVLDRFWLHVGDPQALKDAEMWLACHGG